jgi:hypothetical protein
MRARRVARTHGSWHTKPGAIEANALGGEMNRRASVEPDIRIALWAVAILAGLARIQFVRDPDTPWHLHQAAEVIRLHATSYLDASSYTEPERPYVNVAWLGELMLYGAYNMLGWGGLALFAALAAFGSALIVGRIALRASQERPWLAVIATSLACAAASFRFEPRPHALKLVLVPLAMLWSMEWADPRTDARTSRRLAAQLILMALFWEQAHASFVLMPAIVGVALLGRAMETGPRDLLRRCWLPALIIFSFLSAPDGLDLFSLLKSHSSGDSALHIRELRSMDLVELLPTEVSSFVWIDLLLLLGAVKSWRQRSVRAEDLGFAILGLALALIARRFRALWAIMLVPWAARPHGEPLRRAIPWRFERAAGLLAAILVVPVHTLAQSRLDPMRMFGLGLERDVFPVDAAAVLERSGIEGRLFNEYDDGGWLERELSPRVQIAINGRTPLFFDEELYFLVRRATVQAGPAFEAFESIHHPDLVLIRRERRLCTQLAKDAAWVPAYVDHQRALFARTDRLGRMSVIDPCAPEASIARICAMARSAQDPSIAAKLHADLDQLEHAALDAPYPRILRAMATVECDGQATPATSMVEEALSSGTLRPEVFVLLARLRTLAGDLRGATEAAEAAVAYGGGADAIGRRGLIALASGDARAALPDLKAVVGELGDMTPPDFRLSYAHALLQVGDRRRARREIQRAEWEGAQGADKLLVELGSD